MRILYHHRIASKDGQNVHVDEIVNALRDLGHEVLIVAPASSTEQDFGASVGWVDRLKASLPKALYEVLEMGYSLLAYARLCRAIRAFRPDAIYERYNLFLFSGIWARRRYGIPLLLEVNAPIAQEREKYDGIALKRMADRAQRHIWQGADYVLPVTHVLGKMIEAAGVPEKKIIVIPNGINAAHFSNVPGSNQVKARHGLEGRVVLGFTGFVRDWHGLDRVIRWMALQERTDLHLLVVGDGPARPDLEKLSESLGISGHVTFTGLVQRDSIPELVAAFDVALQPAVVAYASPLKLFEYLAMGRAVIAPRQENLLEVLTDGENAVMFDPSDPQGLETALSQVCSDPELRERLGAASKRAIFEGGLTWRANAQRIVELFESLQK
ncbi:MAG: glycosyltransferase family 4 protein [Burkholderiales bacterium]|nr:glycosyltransferase family 4 protein [Burkholderiales bacterium]